MSAEQLQRPVSRPEIRRQRVQDLLLRPGVWILLAVLVGLFLGMQAGGVSQRYAKLAIGLVFAYVVMRYPLFISVGLLLVLYAFPTVIWIGDTNFVFAMLMLIVWVMKMAMRLESAPRRTYLDWAIAAYILAHILSFMNMETMAQFYGSLTVMRHMTVPILLYYLIVNMGRTQGRLLFFTEMITLGMVLVYFSAFMERYAPGVAFLPRWYLSGLGAKGLFTAPGELRIGGVFTHALLSDTAAMMAILQVYLAIYFKHRPWVRLYHWGVALISVYVISLTGNRGGLIIFAGGVVYFLWIFRGEMNVRRTIAGLVLVVGLLFLGELTMAGFEGDATLLTRMGATHFQRGIPDTRIQAWNYIWDLIMKKPFFGHGPFFDITAFIQARKPIWPHNAFLFYFFTIGIVGLPTFLYLVYRALRRTWVGRGLRVGNISLAQGLTAIFHIGIVQYIAGQMRTDHQRQDAFVYFMWILFGMGVLARAVWEDQKAQERAGPVAASSDERRRAS